MIISCYFLIRFFTLIMYKNIQLVDWQRAMYCRFISDKVLYMNIADG